MSPGPVVLKFGGTSVADAEAIGRLVRHAAAAHQRARAVVVVSALSGITDRLLALAAAAAEGADAAVAGALCGQIAADVAELRNLLHAVRTLKDASPRTRDAVAAFGELLSSRIVE